MIPSPTYHSTPLDTSDGSMIIAKDTIQCMFVRPRGASDLLTCGRLGKNSVYFRRDAALGGFAHINKAV